MWNLCLPLLQKNLRKSVTGSLNLISEALENIDRYALLVLGKPSQYQKYFTDLNDLNSS